MGERERERIETKDESTRTRRRFSLAEKQRMLAEATSPGQSISRVARKYGITTSLLFRWRKVFQLSVAEPRHHGDSEVESLRAQVRELQWLLGKKTHENEILRNAIEMTGEGKTLFTALFRRGDIQ